MKRDERWRKAPESSCPLLLPKALENFARFSFCKARTQQEMKDEKYHFSKLKMDVERKNESESQRAKRLQEKGNRQLSFQSLEEKTVSFPRWTSVKTRFLFSRKERSINTKLTSGNENLLLSCIIDYSRKRLS